MSNDDLMRSETWWHRPEPYSRIELVCDAAVHGFGIAVTIVVGGTLVALAPKSAPAQLAPLLVYLSTLATVLLVSLAFNMAPVAP
jgi:hemolysin III